MICVYLFLNGNNVGDNIFEDEHDLVSMIKVVSLIFFYCCLYLIPLFTLEHKLLYIFISCL